MNTIEPSRTALLVMDLQADIIGRLGEAVCTPLMERTAGLIAVARNAHVPIIYVVVGFRPGYPEICMRNPSFATVTKMGRFVVTTLSPAGSDIAAAVRPEDGDVVVVKHRVGPFEGTDMEMILRAKGIDTLILTGIATSGVVLSTVRYGADADYTLFVVKDCCGDADDEVHRVLTEKVFVRQATVTTASEMADVLRASQQQPTSSVTTH